MIEEPLLPKKRPNIKHKTLEAKGTKISIKYIWLLTISKIYFDRTNLVVIGSL